jgi:hypothetical protein
MVTVEAVPGAIPVTEISPVELLIETEPPRELVPDHVNPESKLEICIWKPVVVPVSVLNIGVRAEPLMELIDVDVAVPVSYPVRVLWIVTVEAVPGFTPVTVMSPVLLIEVVLPSEFVPTQVNAEL